MKLCLNVGDTAVGKDEDWVIWDYTADVDSNFWAVQFDTDTSTGTIEYKDNTPNLEITALPADLQAVFDQHATKKAEQELAAATRDFTIDELRLVRDDLLIDTDWTQMADAPLTDEEKAAWATYRQELRDLPDGYTTTPLNEVTYPFPPGVTE